MSEMLIEHPVVVIEKLLKFRMGDEGRLLYLRKAVTQGQILYDSDKEYLKKMQRKLDLKNPEKISKTSKKDPVLKKKKNNLPKNKSRLTTSKKDLINNKTPEESGISESEITTIQNSISDLKNKDSKIKDNLELLLINREIITQSEIDKNNSFGSFSKLTKTRDADLFSLIGIPLEKEQILDPNTYYVDEFIDKFKTLMGLEYIS